MSDALTPEPALRTDLDEPASASPASPVTPASPEWVDDAAARQALVSATLWVVSAVLCVIASFQYLYSAVLGVAIGLHVNGWGTVTQNGIRSPGHASRFGVVLCVTAALFLVAAGLSWASTRSDRQRLRQTGQALALAATAFLAGSLATMGTVIDSAFSSITSQTNSTDELNKKVAESIDLQIGWLVWLGVIAIVCSGIAFAVPLLTRALAGVRADSEETDED